MKILKIKLLIIILFLSGYKSNAQDRVERGNVANNIISFLEQKRNFVLIEPFVFSKSPDPEGIQQELADYTCLEIDTNNLKFILDNKPDIIELKIPVNPYVYQEFLLYKVNITTNNFELITNNQNEKIKSNEIVHYRGILKNDEFSVAAFTFSHHEIMGFMSNNFENIIVGKLLKENRHIMYSDINMVDEMSFNCETIQIPNSVYQKKLNPLQNQTTTLKCVNFYYEVDYDIFLNKGTVANVNSYIQGAFNQVATLYDNDGININLSTIFVWTSNDPYTGPSTSSFLSQFGNYRTSFNGDLAHLVGYTGSGGIAYVGTLCFSQPFYKMAYSDIGSTYQVIPTYSWTINVLSHEQGHLLGSYHTHDCVWNNNNTAIDGCGPTAGYNSQAGNCSTAPLPNNGGTIMSYCHLLSNVGINFSNGFGPQPKNLIINNINSANCLSTCNPCLNKPDTIIGNKIICLNSISNSTYTCSPVNGATSYTWTLPNGWVGNSNTNTITITNFGSSGRIYVKANASCGSSLEETLYVTVKNIPSTPTKIKGNVNGVCNSAEIYTINKVNNIIYNWSFVGIGGTIVSGQGTDSIFVNFGNNFTDITLRVNATNECGTSSFRTQAIKSSPKMPDNIVGITNPCINQQNVSYSIVPVYNASQYEWIAPFGSTIRIGSVTSNSNKLITNLTNVYVNFSSNSNGGIKVKSINSCGQSFNKSLAINFSCRENKNIVGESLELFPNPSEGKIQVNIFEAENGYYNLRVFDVNQREVHSKYILLNQDINSIFLDLDNLKNGLYHLVISNEKFFINSRFIINK